MNLGKYFACLLLLALTCGCATVQQSRSVEDYVTAKQANEGVVVVSVSRNTGELATISYINLHVMNEQSQTKTYILNAKGDEDRSTVLFAGAVPAGKYKIERLGGMASAGVGVISKYLPVSDSPLLSTFTVEAGKTTDLGRTILTAVNDKVLFGRSRKYPDNAELLNAQYSSTQAELLKQGKAHGWDADIHPKDVSEEAALAVPQGLRSMTELSTGEIVAGTGFGSVALRERSGHWRLFSQIGNYDHVTVVSEYKSDSSIAVVGTENGAFYKIDKAGKSALLAAGDLPKGEIVSLLGSPERHRWFVLLKRNGKGELYASDALENGKWTLLKSDDYGFNAWSGNRYVWAWRMPNGIGYTSTVSAKLSCFDFDSGQWLENATPDKRVPLRVAPDEATGAVGILTSPGGGFAGVFAKTHYTVDCGKTWTDTSSPYSVKVSAPLVLSDGTVLEYGGVFGDAGMYSSSEQGKNETWKKVVDKDVMANNLWIASTQGLFMVSNGVYGFEVVKHSKDNGKTWETELSSFIK